MGLRAPTNGDIEMEDAETAHFNNGIPDFKLFESQPLSPIHITTYYNNGTTPVTTRNSSGFAAPKPVNERKRKLLAAEQQQPGSSTGNGEVTITPIPSTSSAAAGSTSISDKSDNSNKIRRVQNKIRSQYNNNSGNINKEMMSASTGGPSNVIAGNNTKTRGK